jgi:gluconokinase
VPIVDVHDAQQPFVLALDIVTSSTRALIFDRRGQTLRDSESQLGFDLVATPDGGAEVDAAMLFDIVCRSIDDVLARVQVPISAVGISCFWHSLLGLNGRGEPTTPVYLWADTRSRAEVDAIKREFDPAELWRRTGCFVHSSYWPGKLRWLRNSAQGPYRETRQWVAFSDYLLGELFDAEGTTVSMASSTAMLNAASQRWDDMAIAAAGIDAKTLPVIVDQRQPLSALAGTYRDRWPALTECPWFRGIGDGACANVGSGGIGPDRIALTVGTSGAVRMVSPLAVGIAPSAPDTLWTYRLDNERAVVGAAISNGGVVVDWLAGLTRLDFSSDEMAAAAAIAPDAHGLTMLPYLAGERAPIWSDWVSGAAVGLRLATTASDLLRAGMESVAYCLAALYEDLATQAVAEHNIVANGGAILRSPAWLQMLADVLQHPILALPAEEESSARGAALMALEFSGLIASLSDADDPVQYGRIIEPNVNHAAVYLAARDRQKRLLDLLYKDGKPAL